MGALRRFWNRVVEMADVIIATNAAIIVMIPIMVFLASYFGAPFSKHLLDYLIPALIALIIFEIVLFLSRKDKRDIMGRLDEIMEENRAQTKKLDKLDEMSDTLKEMRDTLREINGKLDDISRKLD